MPPDENEQSPINSAEIAVPGNLNPGAGWTLPRPHLQSSRSWFLPGDWPAKRGN